MFHIQILLLSSLLLFRFLCLAVNTDNTVGAVGFVSRIAPHLYPVCTIRVDDVTGDPVRDANGLCIRAEAGGYCLSVCLFVCLFVGSFICLYV